jgi:hypothetical protein
MVIPALRLARDPAWDAALADTTPPSRHHCNGIGFAPHNGASKTSKAEEIIRYFNALAPVRVS